MKRKGRRSGSTAEEEKKKTFVSSQEQFHREGDQEGGRDNERKKTKRT